MFRTKELDSQKFETQQPLNFSRVNNPNSLMNKKGNFHVIRSGGFLCRTFPRKLFNYTFFRRVIATMSVSLKGIHRSLELKKSGSFTPPPILQIKYVGERCFDDARFVDEILIEPYISVGNFGQSYGRSRISCHPSSFQKPKKISPQKKKQRRKYRQYIATEIADSRHTTNDV